MYEISPYSYNKAKEPGVQIKPSTRLHKKIDVYKNGRYITSIGHDQYNDYPMYMKQNKTLAETRRKLYHARHKNDKGITGYYAKKFLW